MPYLEAHQAGVYHVIEGGLVGRLEAGLALAGWARMGIAPLSLARVITSLMAGWGRKSTPTVLASSWASFMLGAYSCLMMAWKTW